jgi:hypothetical protein
MRSEPCSGPPLWYARWRATRSARVAPRLIVESADRFCARRYQDDATVASWQGAAALSPRRSVEHVPVPGKRRRCRHRRAPPPRIQQEIVKLRSRQRERNGLAADPHGARQTRAHAECPDDDEGLRSPSFVQWKRYERANDVSSASAPRMA